MSFCTTHLPHYYTDFDVTLTFKLSVNGERMCTKYWLPLPRGGLPRNSVDRIADRLDMTSAVDRGCKASTKTKNCHVLAPKWLFLYTSIVNNLITTQCHL